MKKVILSFAIVLSSFFIFNSKIEALSEYSFNITFDNINERFYKIKDLSENFLKTSDFNNFVIYFNKNYSDYYVYFYNSDKDVVVCKSFGGFKCFIQTAVDNYTFSSDSSKLTKVGSTNYPSFDDPNLFLYSSVKVSVDDIKVNFNYGSSSYVINENDNYLPIYDLYLKVSEISDPHKEEKEVLESFYSLCIEKLKYLAEVFVSNYIYLAIIVIFIIIFVFKLINRRFL